ncbi:MAG TPA: HPF/RaiA family ribosome-associated protein [Saprospiraceae bacterium]|nr:HPF/RaiA family ribosome-associated protein [Saprospiraceae bacterium]
MIAKIQSIHFDADQKLLLMIQERLDKLAETLKLRQLNANVILKMEKVAKIQDKIVEIIIKLPGKACVARTSSKSFEAAVKKAVDIIKVQILKHKDRIQS